jgi:hypothetical protein
VTIGVFTEDRLNEPLRALLGKLKPGASFRLRFVRQGEMLDHETLKRHVVPLLKQHPEITTILVLRDFECTDPETFRREMNTVETSLSSRHPPVKCFFVPVKHAFEGWLMCDRDAIERVLGVDVARQLSSDPERECRPKQKLVEIADRIKEGKYLPRRDNLRIVQNANVNVIASRSSSFKKLKDILT